jgi:hypothetical protein
MTGAEPALTTATTHSTNAHEVSANNPHTEPISDAPADTSAEVAEDIAAFKEKLSEITATAISHAEPTEASLYYDASTMAPLSPRSLVRCHRNLHIGPPLFLRGRIIDRRIFPKTNRLHLPGSERTNHRLSRYGTSSRPVRGLPSLYCCILTGWATCVLSSPCVLLA